MKLLDAVRARLGAGRARLLLVLGLLVALLPLSRRAPHPQVLVLDVPESFRDRPARVAVVWTRAGDTEPAGGMTLTFQEGAPALIRRELSAPDGTYRLDVALDASRPSAAPANGAAHVEITRQLSLNGAEVRVLLENTPP